MNVETMLASFRASSPVWAMDQLSHSWGDPFKNQLHSDFLLCDSCLGQNWFLPLQCPHRSSPHGHFCGSTRRGEAIIASLHAWLLCCHTSWMRLDTATYLCAPKAQQWYPGHGGGSVWCLLMEWMQPQLTSSPHPHVCVFVRAGKGVKPQQGCFCFMCNLV